MSKTEIEDLKVTEKLVYEDFLSALKNEPLTELEKLMCLVDFLVRKLNRGITHREMTMLGIEVEKKVLEQMVRMGYLLVEKHSFFGTIEKVYEVRWNHAPTLCKRRKEMEEGQKHSGEAV